MITPLDVLSIETWILLFTAVGLIRYYIHRQWQILKKYGIPHDPPTILGFGNLAESLKDPEIFFKKDLEYKKKFGKVYGTYGALTPRMTIWDPDVLKQIQIKEFSTFPDRQAFMRKLNGKTINRGLTAVSGKQWGRIRRSLSPTFSSSKLKEMFGIVEQCSDQMVEALEKCALDCGGIFDPKEILGKLSLDVMCSAAFGVNVFAEQVDEDEPKVLKMAKKLFASSLFRSPLVMIFLLFPSTEKIGEFFNYSIFPPDAVDYFSSLINAVIRRKKEQGSKTRVDLLKCMLEIEIDKKDTETAERGISRAELIGNSMLMLLAGYDTTSSVMMFLTYNLAVYEDCQKKLRCEIEETVSKYGGLTYEAINSMKYLMMCINETMRLYPPTVRNSRFCTKEITINGIRIPKNIHVDIPVYGLTRDPEYWDEPSEFRPERFEDMSKIDSIIFQPFGVGPRNCIGMRFALMEVKMAVCKILQNFRLDVGDDTPEPPLEIIFRLNMRPKVDKLQLKVIPLKEQSTEPH